MAKVVWTEPALGDLDAIADYIALDNPKAARDLVRRVFSHVEQLAAHPKSGSKPPELKGWRYRQIVEPPCRVFYRHDNGRVLILYVMRSERRLRPRLLVVRGKRAQRR
ncbi:MAG TPA: type II toxin-antitoxin system RelE/ParE family toxin [Polyangiaceae bacterium]|nr:type II toxin-antitoxin system RelE/ParE family toxin [Polyangiaceae bacterium]